MYLKKIIISSALLLLALTMTAFASENDMRGAGEDSGGEYFEDNGSFNERSEEESRELEEIMESINAELEESSQMSDKTGRIIFICKSDSISSECIRIVAYDERDKRYEFDLTKSSAYTVSESVPVGRYNIINAYDENGNMFFLPDDYFIISEGNTTSVSVFKATESRPESKYIEPLPEEESVTDEVPDEPDRRNFNVLLPVSIALIAALAVFIIGQHRRVRK